MTDKKWDRIRRDVRTYATKDESKLDEVWRLLDQAKWGASPIARSGARFKLVNMARKLGWKGEK